MINSINQFTTYKNSKITISLIETDKESIDKLLELSEKYSNELEGIKINEKQTTVSDILMFGDINTLTKTHKRQITPYTEAELDKPIWVTDAVKDGDKWVGDIHPDTGMPMMYQSYRKPEVELDKILNKLETNQILVLKTYN